jgi:hypothetical protein
MLLSDTLAPKSRRAASDKAKKKQETCASDRTRKRRSDSIQIALPLYLSKEKVSPVQSFPSINSSPSQNAKKQFSFVKKTTPPAYTSVQASRCSIQSNPIQSIPIIIKKSESSKIRL